MVIDSAFANAVECKDFEDMSRSRFNSEPALLVGVVSVGVGLRITSLLAARWED